jgi:hypothetical protein
MQAVLETRMDESFFTLSVSKDGITWTKEYD